jgi:hypothetical protein
MAQGWRPSGAKENKTAPTDEAQPAPPRRRTRMQRRNAADDAAHPLTTEARKALPREATGARPRAGRKEAPDEPRRRVNSVKVTLGDRWSRIIMDIKAGAYTWQEFVDDLDEEELARGQLRADDGSFVGRPPTLVPREFLLACQREQKRRFEIIFGSEVLGIARSYVELCKSNAIPEKDRAKMMQYAMERIFGPIPRDIRVSQEAPWEQTVVNVVSDGQDGMSNHLQRRYAGYAERQGGAVEGDES